MRAHLWVPVIGMIGSIPFLLAFLLWPADHRIALPGDLPAVPVAFFFSVFASVLGAMCSAPFLAAVQGLARLRMRASAAALFSLAGSGVGSALGPLLIGDLNVRLAPTYGDEAIRWALVFICLAVVLSAITSALAARTFRDDLESARDGAGEELEAAPTM